MSAVPPADSLWTLIDGAVVDGKLNRNKVHLVAARLATGMSKPIPASYADVADADAELLAALIAELKLAA